MNYAVENRLRLIDFLLERYGHVGRNEVCAFYGVSQPQATRDFSLYKKQRPDNVTYNPTTRCYQKTETFRPLFNNSLETQDHL